jgi:HlyD family secretion protein
MTLHSPIGGIVLEQSAHIGELAVPGLPVITLANLDTVDLTVYLPEDQLNRVRLNQTVQVTVDSFPSRNFEGMVLHINSAAEFTPQGVQTREERVNLVYGVKIRIENPGHDLKPGMPADAHFE